MHREPAGKVILDRVMMARFAPVSDGDYDPICNMARLASQITWS
jgi:hypothetical protein